MKKTVITIVSIAIVILLGLFIIKSIDKKSKSQQTEKKLVRPTPAVKVMIPTKEQIPMYYVANAVLQAKTSAHLKPEVSGRVEKLYVEEGSFVKAGQLLALIQPEKEQYQIESQLAVINQLEANYLNKKEIYERRKQLYERDLIAKEEVDNAKTDMEVALNQLNSAKATLKEYARQKNETVIKAPFDGIVDKRYVSVGDYVDSQKEMFYVLKLNPMWAVFELPQEYIKNLKTGQEVEVDVDGVGVLKGKVDYISSSLNENNLIVVKVLLDNKNGLLKENMFAKVKIETGKAEGYKLPEDAVQLSGNENFVYVVENSKAKPVLVKVIKQEFGYVYITGNISPEDKVIVSNFMNVKPGSTVKVIQ